jgi:hypothetical protein
MTKYLSRFKIDRIERDGERENTNNKKQKRTKYKRGTLKNGSLQKRKNKQNQKIYFFYCKLYN